LFIVDPFITKQARQLSKLGGQLSDEVNGCHSAATGAVQQGSNGLGVYATQGIDWCLGVRSYDLLQLLHTSLNGLMSGGAHLREN
jgi:hypothetical protein